MTDGLALATRGLQKKYDSRTALAGLDLSVPNGVVYGFLGPNGAGKTTTMRLLTGLIHPDAGTIEVLGRPFGRRDRRHLFEVGALIDALVAAGANNVQGPQFTIEDHAARLVQARDKALAAAAERANYYAGKAGARSARDLVAVIGAAARGGGERVSDAEIAALPVAGGLGAFAEAVAAVFAATFEAEEPRPFERARTGAG